MGTIKKAFEETMLVMGLIFTFIIVINFILPLNPFENTIFYLLFGLAYFLIRYFYNRKVN